jgi:class 3 adenylate cyclase
MRGCDWYGSAVNVAARLSGQAEPNEALISAATREAADVPAGRLDGCRELVLKGIARPVATWRLA